MRSPLTSLPSPAYDFWGNDRLLSSIGACRSSGELDFIVNHNQTQLDLFIWLAAQLHPSINKPLRLVYSNAVRQYQWERFPVTPPISQSWLKSSCQADNRGLLGKKLKCRTTWPLMCVGGGIILLKEATTIRKYSYHEHVYLVSNKV